MATLRVWEAEVLTCGLWAERVGDGHVCRVRPRLQLLFFTQTQGMVVETTAAALATVEAGIHSLLQPQLEAKGAKEARPTCSSGSALRPGLPPGPLYGVQPALWLAACQGVTVSLVAPCGICWVWTQNQPGWPG